MDYILITLYLGSVVFFASIIIFVFLIKRHKLVTGWIKIILLTTLQLIISILLSLVIYFFWTFKFDIMLGPILLPGVIAEIVTISTLCFIVSRWRYMTKLYTVLIFACTFILLLYISLFIYVISNPEPHPEPKVRPASVPKDALWCGAIYERQSHYIGFNYQVNDTTYNFTIYHENGAKDAHHDFSGTGFDETKPLKDQVYGGSGGVIYPKIGGGGDLICTPESGARIRRGIQRDRPDSCIAVFNPFGDRQRQVTFTRDLSAATANQSVSGREIKDSMTISKIYNILDELQIDTAFSRLIPIIEIYEDQGVIVRDYSEEHDIESDIMLVFNDHAYIHSNYNDTLYMSKNYKLPMRLNGDVMKADSCKSRHIHCLIREYLK